MRPIALALILTGFTLGAPAVAHAQYFDFTTSFLPGPITTTQPGTYITVTNGHNTSGGFAGVGGTDIGLADFSVVAASNSPGTFNTAVTESITLTPSNNLGVALPGDTAVTHTFLLNYSGTITNSSTDTTLTGWPSVAQLYTFADGSVFSVDVTSYSGPGFDAGFTDGAMGGHVVGALGGIAQATPEPGSMALLIGLGIAGTGALTVKRGRTRRQA